MDHRSDTGSDIQVSIQVRCFEWFAVDLEHSIKFLMPPEVLQDKRPDHLLDYTCMNLCLFKVTQVEVIRNYHIQSSSLITILMPRTVL